MKKVFLLLSCCAFMAACNSNSSTSENTNGGVESPDADSASSAAMSAATRQSDADTTSLNIGTDRTAGAAGGANVENGAKLIAQSDCTGCHRIDQKLVGPAYEAVAQKYQNNEKDTEYLSEKIIKGGAGVWGEIAMTPHPNLSKEEATQMAQYILSLKK